jgi:hypothetical protein
MTKNFSDRYKFLTAEFLGVGLSYSLLCCFLCQFRSPFIVTLMSLTEPHLGMIAEQA